MFGAAATEDHSILKYSTEEGLSGGPCIMKGSQSYIIRLETDGPIPDVLVDNIVSFVNKPDASYVTTLLVEEKYLDDFDEHFDVCLGMKDTPRRNSTLRVISDGYDEVETIIVDGIMDPRLTNLRYLKQNGIDEGYVPEVPSSVGEENLAAVRDKLLELTAEVVMLVSTWVNREVDINGIAIKDLLKWWHDIGLKYTLDTYDENINGVDVIQCYIEYQERSVLSRAIYRLINYRK